MLASMHAPAASALVLCAVAGCGDNLVKIDSVRSGPRLRARWWESAAGFRTLAGWRDTALDLECAPLDEACAPRVTAYFADAGCRELVAASPGELPPLAMYVDGNIRVGHGIRITDEPFDGTIYASWRGCVVAGRTDATARFARGVLERDVQVATHEPIDLGTRVVWPDGAEAYVAAPDAIAAAGLGVGIEDGPGRLRARYLGTLELPLAAGILDLELDAPCAPAPDLAGEVRCLPAFAAPIYVAAFTDPACTQPVGAPLYRAPGFAIEAGGYVAVDAAVAGPAYVRAADRCVPTTITALWRAGAPLDPAAFVALTEVED
jgi:hypothetical protein